MAIYTNGILGTFSGTIGSVVGSTWNGIQVIRSKPVRKKTGLTPSQEQQIAKFSLMTKFLRPLTELLNQTFQKPAAGMTCFNRAFSLNYPAITGEYPAIGIDYSRILLSKGRLPLGEPPTISSPEAGKLLMTWRTGDGINRRLTSGSAFMAAWQEEFGRWIFGQFDAGDGISSCILDIVPFSGRAVQTYVGFISTGRQKSSESRYMGVLNIV